MNIDDARKRLLIYAVDRLGRDETAKRLNTTVAGLDAWVARHDGTAEPRRSRACGSCLRNAEDGRQMKAVAQAPFKPAPGPGSYNS